MALAVILLVIFYGLKKHKLGFFKLFVPSGVPGVLLPFIVVIEVLSFISRPIWLSIRLFANMLAGHITLKVFAGFVVALGSARLRRHPRRDPAAVRDRRADGAGIPGRGAAGLCLRHPDLPLSQRRPASRTLSGTPGQPSQSPLEFLKEH